MNRAAFVTHVATVSASLRQGMTTVSSTGTPFTVYRYTRLCIVAPGLAGWSVPTGKKGYGFERNACGETPGSGQSARREQAVRRGSDARRAAAGGRRTGVPLAVLVQRLVQLRVERGAADPRPDAAVRILGVP